MAPRTTETVLIPTGDDHPVRADFYPSNDNDLRAVVVLCHGFKGYKTWGFLPYLAERIRTAGMAALSMDFSFNGTYPETNRDVDASPSAEWKAPSEKSRYPQPGLFARNTLKREYHDLRSAIRHIKDTGLEGRLDMNTPVGLFGHSRGGVAAVLNAIEDPSVAALCTWSTTTDPDFFSKEQKEKWRRTGRYEFRDSKEGIFLSTGIEYLDDLEKNHEFYLLRSRVRELNKPHLIVHGTFDLVVKVDCAKALHEAESQLKEKRLVLLQTGHTFGVSVQSIRENTPAPKALSQATEETVSWFKMHLL